MTCGSFGKALQLTLCPQVCGDYLSVVWLELIEVNDKRVQSRSEIDNILKSFVNQIRFCHETFWLSGKVKRILWSTDESLDGFLMCYIHRSFAVV